MPDHRQAIDLDNYEVRLTFFARAFGTSLIELSKHAGIELEPGQLESMAFPA